MPESVLRTLVEIVLRTLLESVLRTLPEGVLRTLPESVLRTLPEAFLMIEGGVESLGADGVFVGWLRDTEDLAPAVLQIRAGEQIVAEAVARSFRPDLLAGGHGHGHYGFAARARGALAPGLTAFEMFLPRRDQGIRVALNVLRLAVPGPARVEILFAPEQAWRVRDLAAAPGCLALAAQQAAMGTARFVDVTFRFALRRWPSADEAIVFRAALEGARLTPDDFLLELLGGRERADLGDALASPWAPEYPYTQVATGAPARRRRKGME